jgi:hypothetical protein
MQLQTHSISARSSALPNSSRPHAGGPGACECGPPAGSFAGLPGVEALAGFEARNGPFEFVGRLA